MPTPEQQVRLTDLELKRIRAMPDDELEALCADPDFAWLKNLSDGELRRLLAAPTPRHGA